MKTAAKVVDSTVEAEAARERLAARMAAGEAVSAAEWERAEAGVRFAHAQSAAVERGERDRTEAERVERVERLRRELPERLDPAPLERARAKLADAVEAFVVACREHDDRHGAAYYELTDGTIAPLPADMGIAMHHLRPMLRVGGQEYGPARPQVWLSTAAHDALARHYPRTMRSLDRPQD